MKQGMKRGIFLDRDGVLNALVYYFENDEWESPRHPEHYQLLPGALEVLKALQAQGWLLFLVSNQPSYAKGKTSLEALHAVHAELDQRLTAAQITLAGVYYCYHHPKGIMPDYSGPCECRKPGIASLLKAQAAYDLDLAACWFVGDQDIDVECGQRAGCRTIQIAYAPSQNKRGQAHPDYRCDDITAVPAIIAEATRVGAVGTDL